VQLSCRREHPARVIDQFGVRQPTVDARDGEAIGMPRCDVEDRPRDRHL